ncbi:MAG: integrase [Rhodoferax sp.]|uniref:tyrosine-type recombinase/integrase n=1 Tax=Rhodoferax sp. TaxID=50421 RepID=UPI0017DF1DA1|nr:integrase [Rhodoferax sp.]NMM12457.1 integrase [Rhodoferax sp.]
MATKINTVSARDALKLRREPYWHLVTKGKFLGYRKMTIGPGGTWITRGLDESTGKQNYHALGAFLDVPDNERFNAAFKTAQDWFGHIGSGGSKVVLTLGEACQRYIDKARAEGRESGAVDLEGRFRRWVFSDAKLSNTPVMKLTAGMMNDWRNKLVKTPAIEQDKTKKATKPRAASSINREMAVLKAALNLALEDGHATSDTAWKTKLRPIKDATQRRDCYLDMDQRRALIASAPADLAALITALSLIPLRPGAVAALTAGSFDKRLSVLTVGKDKAGRDRKITLPSSTASFFAAQAKDKLPTAPLIARADGKFWNKDSWKDPFKAAAKAADLPAAAVAYNLRHSAITDLIALHRLDTMTVAQLSGTSVSMIDKHYGHLLRDHAATGLGKLALF